jgi:hypothetical protein
VIALAIAPSANAATLGSTAQADSPCGPQAILFGGSGNWLVPSGGGVITSLSTNTVSTSGHVSIKVLRLGGLVVTVVGTTPEQTITAAGPLTVSHLRIPVVANDALGVWSSDGYKCLKAGGGTYGYVTSATDPQVGEAGSVVAAGTGVDVAVSANFEPDADHDNFGDTTQDACPADPARHNAPCRADLALTAKATPTKIGVGGVTGLVTTVTDKGPASGVASVLSINPGPGLKMLARGPVCTFTTAFNCSLGLLAPGSKTKSVFVLKGTSPGKHKVLMNVSSSTPDPVAANNTVSRTIKVKGKKKKHAAH